jgi:hypothetical protein
METNTASTITAKIRMNATSQERRGFAFCAFCAMESKSIAAFTSIEIRLGRVEPA